VVGVGINLRLPAAIKEALRAEGLEATDLASVGNVVPVRSFAAAALINELALALEEFGTRGMSAFADEWQGADALANRPVRVLQGEQTLEGLARGVDADGALLLDAGDGRRRILSGEVSVRPVQ
jgi:BirA family biotin operon repressor/biotin-[acetyl-CoA-carboxylase] ligase